MSRAARLSDGDPAETRGGDGLDRASDPEIRPSAFRPALAILAVAAAPFERGARAGLPARGRADASVRRDVRKRV